MWCTVSYGVHKVVPLKHDKCTDTHMEGKPIHVAPTHVVVGANKTRHAKFETRRPIHLYLDHKERKFLKYKFRTLGNISHWSVYLVVLYIICESKWRERETYYNKTLNEMH